MNQIPVFLKVAFEQVFACSRITLRASEALRVTLEQNVKFVKISIFGDHVSDFSSGRDFSQGIKSTQPMYFWIALDLILEGKLLRSQLNSQIMTYLNFCDQFFPLFDKHV